MVWTVDGRVIDHFLEHRPIYVGHERQQRLVDQRNGGSCLDLDPGVVLGGESFRTDVRRLRSAKH